MPTIAIESHVNNKAHDLTLNQALCELMFLLSVHASHPSLHETYQHTVMVNSTIQ